MSGSNHCPVSSSLALCAMCILLYQLASLYKHIYKHCIGIIVQNHDLYIVAIVVPK